MTEIFLLILALSIIGSLIFFEKAYRFFFPLRQEPDESEDAITDIIDISVLQEEDMFWYLIDETGKKKNQDNGNHYDCLYQVLVEFMPEIILSFRNRFEELMENAYTPDLWGAAKIIDDSCSDMKFMDFRAWLIGQGETIYLEAVKNPEYLAELPEIDPNHWEGIYHAPYKAFKEAFGREMPPNQTELNTFFISDQFPDKVENLSSKLPKLYKKYKLK